MHKKQILVLISILLLLSMACGLASAPLSPMSKTLTPLSAAVAGTATARNLNVGGPAEQLAAAVATATSRSADIYATQTARASLNSADRQATATVIAPVVAELPRYGIDPGQGHVAWVHKPVTLDISGYNQTAYANDYPTVTAKNFVMAADITWYTVASMSACGFMFRSNGDKAKSSQYMVGITRYATGYLGFSATYNGELSNAQTFYPHPLDKTFSWFNNATNRLVVVARGPLLDLYTNGTLIATVDTTKPPPDSYPSPPTVSLPQNATAEQKQQYQSQLDQNKQTAANLQGQLATARKNFAKNKPFYTDGLLGFVDGSQSGGQSKCTFSNAWLFIIDR
jgi:hypothetical protein